MLKSALGNSEKLQKTSYSLIPADFHLDFQRCQKDQNLSYKGTNIHPLHCCLNSLFNPTVQVPLKETFQQLLCVGKVCGGVLSHFISWQYHFIQFILSFRCQLFTIT